jgi:pimeloyl-ACP methyl ester carboxylesterase
MLVVWGKYDPSFTTAGAEAYKKNVPGCEIHILDAGHFALDEVRLRWHNISGIFLTGCNDKIIHKEA